MFWGLSFLISEMRLNSFSQHILWVYEIVWDSGGPKQTWTGKSGGTLGSGRSVTSCHKRMRSAGCDNFSVIGCKEVQVVVWISEVRSRYLLSWFKEARALLPAILSYLYPETHRSKDFSQIHVGTWCPYLGVMWLSLYTTLQLKSNQKAWIAVVSASTGYLCAE